MSLSSLLDQKGSPLATIDDEDDSEDLNWGQNAKPSGIGRDYEHRKRDSASFSSTRANPVQQALQLQPRNASTSSASSSSNSSFVVTLRVPEVAPDLFEEAKTAQSGADFRIY
jgi:hypothetical protein